MEHLVGRACEECLPFGDVALDVGPYPSSLISGTIEQIGVIDVGLANGGNKDFLAWEDLCYQGDVHGSRFPNIGDPNASWNVNGGYAPEEMIEPGRCPGQGPVKS